MIKWIKKKLIYNKSHSQLPIIKKENDWYKCYITSRNIQNESFIKKIYFKIDPIIIKENEKDILKGDNEYDINGVMSSCIVNYDNKEYLYYTGWKKLESPYYKHTICLAIDYCKHPQPIIISKAEDFNICSSPFVMIENNIWRMWFISGKNCDGWVKNYDNTFCPTYGINYAESNDGFFWFRKKIYFPREYREIFSRPFVFKENGIYKMFYSKLMIKIPKNYTIGYAESNDGLTWKRLDSEVGIHPSKKGWDSQSIAFPWIDDKYLFYSGNNFGKSGFGYAERF